MICFRDSFSFRQPSDIQLFSIGMSVIITLQVDNDNQDRVSDFVVVVVGDDYKQVDSDDQDSRLCFLR